MKKQLIIALLVLFCAISVFAGEAVEYYTLCEEWNSKDSDGNVIVSGYIKVRIGIEVQDNNTLKVSIYKEITPYSQVLHFEIIAHKEKRRYVFEGTDNWGNGIEGYLQREGDAVQLYMNIVNANDTGKNMGRYYGDVHLLKKEISVK